MGSEMCIRDRPGTRCTSYRLYRPLVCPLVSLYVCLYVRLHGCRLSICLSAYLSACLPVCIFRLPLWLSYLSSVSLPANLSAYCLYACLSAGLPVCLHKPIYLSVYQPVCQSVCRPCRSMYLSYLSTCYLLPVRPSVRPSDSSCLSAYYDYVLISLSI